LIAAESTGRICFGVEIDPTYVDVAIRRWQAFSGQRATRERDGFSFDEAASEAAELACANSEGGLDQEVTK
jgi:hypothetical protein